ncbi:MAG: hypothetical protein XD76_0436 [candidate division TA06 bacterium 32_111]|uniref:PDZ domain-containing protein n=2 Tax=Bacteria candidate phyla TaxID=1783234 RepID=A0A101I331_UNCT6|nr:MAG: hypothetical protein XD76_0436 [candidate division TA06 bacterium 32_111]KUK87328.1 MAG: hypothetical protein XE03_0726 [candidate division TA06 bacterium 34_109]HAF07839.1 hypothetical protein [candidate division WOR-3 bacterium]HCP17357.1 hypothetical protein [candidate division WOR-3 bacterium]
MRYNFNLFIILSVIIIVVNFLGFYNIYKLSSDGAIYKENDDRTIEIVYIKHFSPAFFSNLEVGDKIVALNGKVPKSLFDLKGNIIEKGGVDKVYIYTITRDKKILNIPVKLGYYYSRNFFIFELIMVFLIFFLSFLFYLSFGENSKESFFVFLFYSLISVAHIFSLVSFITYQLYIFLIISASFLPAIIIHFSFILKKDYKKEYLVVTYLVSFFLFLIWLVRYLIFALTLTKSNLNRLMTTVKITQFSISIMTMVGIILMIYSIYYNIKEKKFDLVTTFSILFLLGFLPYIFLYAFPVSFGKKEILPVNLCLSFSIIPLLSALIYKNYLNSKL